MINTNKLYKSNQDIMYTLITQCKELLDECISPYSNLYPNQCVNELLTIFNSKEVLEFLNNKNINKGNT